LSSSGASQEHKVVMVPVDQILIPEERVTSVLDDEIMAELRESIKQHGILQPLQLAKVNNQLVLIDGLHRLMVAKELGIKEVPAIVTEMDEKQLLITNLIVNRQRGKSNPADEARVLRKLVEEYGMDIYEAAAKLGMSRTTADRYYRIAVKCTEKVLEYLGRGLLSVGCAYWLSFIEDINKQNEIADYAVQYQYTVEQCKAAAASASAEIPIESVKFIVTPTGEVKPKPIPVFPCGKEVDPSRVVTIQIDAEVWPIIEESFRQLCQEGFFYREEQQSVEQQQPQEEATSEVFEQPQAKQPQQPQQQRQQVKDWFQQLFGAP